MAVRLVSAGLHTVHSLQTEQHNICLYCYGKIWLEQAANFKAKQYPAHISEGLHAFSHRALFPPFGPLLELLSVKICSMKLGRRVLQSSGVCIALNVAI